MHKNYEKRFEFEQKDDIKCPHCESKYEDDFFYDCKEEDDCLILEKNCDFCKKSFIISLDKYNQNLGYSIYPKKCEKDKHRFKYLKNYEDREENKKYKIYSCSNCWETDYRLLKENGKEYSKKELSDLHFNSREENKPFFELKEGEVFVDDDRLSIITKKPIGNKDLFSLIVKFLNNLGYETKTPDRLNNSEFMSISRYYTHGIWNNLEFEAHYYPNGMSFEFFQNKYPGKRGQGNGRYEFDKKEQMPYLLKKKLEFSLNKMLGFIKNLNNTKFSIKERKIEIIDWHGNPNIHDSRLSYTDKVRILKSHIYNKKIEDYQRKDSSGKLLACGELKYFYNYEKILCRGYVYHNCNNMWWVITNEDILNLSSSEFFDYDVSLKIKKKNSMKILKDELQKEINNQNFERCVVLKKIIDKNTV